MPEGTEPGGIERWATTVVRLPHRCRAAVQPHTCAWRLFASAWLAARRLLLERGTSGGVDVDGEGTVGGNAVGRGAP
jgi:hypothetical protein